MVVDNPTAAIDIGDVLKAIHELAYRGRRAGDHQFTRQALNDYRHAVAQYLAHVDGLLYASNNLTAMQCETPDVHA
jgi:hypothetical protein